MYSQAEEDDILNKLLWLHDMPEPGYFVEIGVGPGNENNTRALAERGWRGLWIGDEPLLVGPPKGVIFHQLSVTPENVKDLLLLAPPRVDVFSLDIDGNDYWVGREAIPYLQPRIVIVEYNHTYQGKDAIMPYTPNYRWHLGQACGASLDAWKALLEPDYELVYTTFKQVNAFFVRKEVAMRNALEEALTAIDELRDRLALNEGRPSAEEIIAALTRVMALIGESQQIATSTPPADTDDAGSKADAVQLAQAVDDEPSVLGAGVGESPTYEPDTTVVLPSAPDDVRRPDAHDVSRQETRRRLPRRG